jgi:ribosomal protein S18 acetylase RimI-like enzyme
VSVSKTDEAQAYLATFRALIDRPTGPVEAGEWWRAGVPVEEAAAWATLNYRPGEAAPLRAQGVTPDEAAVMESAEAAVAGGSDALALDRVAALHGSGMFVDPVRVERRPDPDDPEREVITIWPEIISITSEDPRFSATVGPYLGSTELAAELDGPVRDLPGKRWWVVLDDAGVAVGFCGAIDAGDEQSLEIETFWIHPATRGRGIGGRLLGQVIAAYPGRRLHAWCSAGSRRLFERAGFQILQEAPADAPVWWAEVERDA